MQLEGRLSNEVGDKCVAIIIKTYGSAALPAVTKRSATFFASSAITSEVNVADW